MRFFSLKAKKKFKNQKLPGIRDLIFCVVLRSHSDSRVLHENMVLK